MMKKLLILAFLFLPFTAFASTQIIYFRSAELGRTAAFYLIPNFLQGTASITTFTDNLPLAGTFSNLTANVDRAPGTGVSWIFTLNDLGTDRSVTCTISNAATSCSDAADTFTAAAGDYITVHVTTSGGTPLSTPLYASLQFSPTTANQTAIFAAGPGNAGMGSTHYEYVPLVGAAMGNGDLTQGIGATTTIPEAGTLSNFYGVLSTSLTSGSYTFSLRQNAATTSLACTVTAQTCNDATHTVSASANDQFGYSTAPNTPNIGKGGNFSMVFTPSTAGDFDLFTSAVNSNNVFTDSATVNIYYPIISTPFAVGVPPIEASSSIYADAMTITKLIVNSNVVPGAGKSKSFTLMDGGVATAATCTISGAASTNCSWTGSVSVARGDKVDIRDAPSGTPAPTSNNIALVATVSSTPPPSTSSFFGWFWSWWW